MDAPSPRGIPLWVWGLVVGLVLIVISSQGRVGFRNPALSQQFAAQPNTTLDPNFQLPQLSFAGLPAGLQQAARDLQRALGLGQAGAPLEAVAVTPRLRVEIRELKPAENGLVVRGTVTNTSAAELRVPISAFELRDSSGASYLAGGGASVTLKPGENTPLELSVPLPAGRGLLLITSLPPDLPVEQKLLVSEP